MHSYRLKAGEKHLLDFISQLFNISSAGAKHCVIVT